MKHGSIFFCFIIWNYNIQVIKKIKKKTREKQYLELTSAGFDMELPV